MNNPLFLHEAVVIALINLDKKTYSASFEDIADYIEKRGLFIDRKGNISLSTQVMLRTTQSQGRYYYLFKRIGKDKICLRSDF